MESLENKGTILYVEDNPDNRLLVKRILLAEDYSLLEAIDGVGHYERIKKCQKSYDLSG